MNSTKEEEINLIDRLYNRCLIKLRKNRFKNHWKTLSIEDAIFRLKEEVRELEIATKKDLPIAEIYNEAADVANFAAFVMDIYKEQKFKNQINMKKK